MARFVLKSKLNSLLKNNGKPPIVEIIFLGTGGAFDLVEKNSSAIIRTSIGSILIDCGSTVYSELQAKKLVESIDYVFITHCHEDHIGSLSTLIYHKYFVEKKSVRIECIPALENKIRTYLTDVCGHEGVSKKSYEINSNSGVVYEDLSMIIHKIDTTNYHYKNYPTGGFVFNFRKGGEDFFVIYSGDVNIPITDIIEENYPKLYESLLNNKENVFIFHESTSRDYSPSYPHCEYQKLERTAEIFPNIYTYHHSQEETKSVVRAMRESRIKLEAIKNAIDVDLNKKLYLVKTHELQEKLRVQAKRLKDDFEEDLYISSLKIKDLNTIGKELVIQEEMDL